MERSAAKQGARSELAKVNGDLDRLVQAILDGVPASRVKGRMAAREARKAELEALLAEAVEKPVLLHPNTAEVYRVKVARLVDALNDEDDRTEAAEIVRGLIDRIVLTPKLGNGQRSLSIDLEGALAGVLALATNDKRPLPGSGLDGAVTTLVAGACNTLCLLLFGRRLTIGPHRWQSPCRLPEGVGASGTGAHPVMFFSARLNPRSGGPMVRRARPLYFIAATAFLVTARDAPAQSSEELMRIIREQQRQIEELSRKVDALTGQTEAVTERAQATEQAATAAETADASDFLFEWGPSPTITSKDGSWSVHVRGRLFVDGGALGDDDDLYRNDNGTELRAARLGIEGSFLEGWRYRLEADFADSDVKVDDAYLQYGGALIDPAYIRTGHFKTPNSLEELTSSRFITFMERAAITDAFELDRRIGLGGGASGNNWGLEAGLFGQNASEVNDNEGYALAGRGHYALFLDPEDRGEDSSQVIHVGASARYRNFDNDTFNSEVTYRQRPFFHFTATRSVSTGSIPDAEGDVWAGAEFAWVNGPFSLQSEIANTALHRKHGEDDVNNLWGGYLSASYFLTGEHRNYDPESGAFDRVEVGNPLHEGGFGAWELAGRADYIDLNNEGVKGGEQISYIAGVNWYANDYVRFMLDGAVTHVFDARNTDAAVTGSQNVIYGGGVRAQVDW